MNCKNTDSTILLGQHEVGSKSMECRECLSYLNSARLLHKVHKSIADGSIDKDLNVKRAGESALKFCHEMTLDEHYVYLKMMETFTAMVSYAYSQKLVEVRLADAATVKKYNGDSFNKALAEAKKANRPKKELKHLSDKDKAIAVLTAAGIDHDSATKAIEEQFRAQGKSIS